MVHVLFNTEREITLISVLNKPDFPWFYLSVFIYNVSCPLNISYHSLHTYLSIKYPFIEDLYGMHYYRHWRMVLMIYYTLFGERDNQTIQFQAAINPMKKNKLE